MAPAMPPSARPSLAKLARRALVMGGPAVASHHWERRGLTVNHTQAVTLGVIAAYVVVIAILWNLPYVRWVLWPFKVRTLVRGLQVAIAISYLVLGLKMSSMLTYNRCNKAPYNIHVFVLVDAHTCLNILDSQDVVETQDKRIYSLSRALLTSCRVCYFPSSASLYEDCFSGDTNVPVPT